MGTMTKATLGTMATVGLLGRAAVITGLIGLATVTAPLRAAGPCDVSTSPPAPHPPGGQPQPFIGGHVLIGENTSVSGATVRLHRCDGTTDVVIASQSTANDGSYKFEALTGPSWYYVVADLSGPLFGTSPVAAPSLIGIGSAAPAVDLAHE